MVLITPQFRPIWCKKSGSSSFCNRFASGRFQFCKYSRRAMRGMNNRWVAGQRGWEGVGAGWWEGWRGVWWGLDGMEGDGAIRTRRTLILVKCKNYLAIITRLLSSSLFRNFSTQQYIHIFTISTLIPVKCKNYPTINPPAVLFSVSNLRSINEICWAEKIYKH